MKSRQKDSDSGQETLEAGDLRIEPGLRRVTRAGEELALPGLTFDLLMALVRGAPNLLSADRLIEAVWGEQVVSPETVTQRVKLLRDALGDDSQSPRYVAGARGQGYRFVPPVTVGHPAIRTRRPVARWIVPVAAVSLIAVIAIVLYAVTSRDTPHLPSGGAVIEEASVAVLPFENRSLRQEDAFFAEGIHDDLLARLSRVPSLRVIARTSVAGYRDRGAELANIARELGVAAIVTGSVQRAGDTVRVHVQLTDTVRDTQLWAETYDRALTLENVLAIQSEISQAITSRLQVALAPSDRTRLHQPMTTSLPAYESWLKGRQEMSRYTPEGIAAALIHFEEALAADPNFALAHASKAESHALQARFRLASRETALQRAGSSVDRALAIDPRSAEALAVKGDVLRMLGQHEAAEAALRQAIALNANLASAFVSYGWLLGAQGRTADQMETWRRAGLLDPRSPVAGVHGAFTNLRTGRYAEAERQLRNLLARHPGFPPAYVLLGEVDAERGNQAEAVRHYRRALALNPALPLAHAGLVGALLDLEADDEASIAIHRAEEVPDMPELAPKLNLAALMAEETLTSVGRHRISEEIAALRSADPEAAAHSAALLHLRDGRIPEARAELESIEPRPVTCTYAFTLLSLGERARGSEIARSVIRSEGGAHGRRRLVDPIVCRIAAGESKEALALLSKSAGEGVPGGWRLLVARPELVELRRHPEMAEIVSTIRAAATRQRAALQSHPE